VDAIVVDRHVLPCLGVNDEHPTRPGDDHVNLGTSAAGPGGVFIVDTKAWKDVTIHDDRIHRGQEDVTDDILNLADLAYTAEGDLAEVGLAPGEVRPVVVLAGRQGIDESIGPVRIVGERDVLKHIARYGTRLTPAQVDVVLVRAMALFPVVGAPAPVNVTLPEPVLPAPPATYEVDALISEEEVQAALLEGILASPIEEWMSFLHPSQAKLVRRSFNGPSRIRGPAGTGKTVVGLHRAAYLARTRPGRVLVATFVKTLPEVMRSQLTRMAPDVVDRVEFTGIHRLALRLLNDRGVTVRLDDAKARAAFERVWQKVGQPGRLGASSRNGDYWRDEIAYVIKGRGITQFDQYADLARTGRRHPLTTDQRRAVWELYTAYDAELRAAGVDDFEDVVLLAETELRRRPLDEPYTAVIVDEAQDLTCAMARLLYGLAGDGPDGFTLIGDGQQSIYPGGYTLPEVGISLAGRGVVLDVNYRNTAEILAFASRLVDGDEFADIEGVVGRGDRPVSVVRAGPVPTHVRCASWAERDRLVVERVRAVTREVGTGLGDVGVLCLTSRGVAAVSDALRRAGLPVVLLTDYDGAAADAVKVGTVKRAKGLEFKHVLIADASDLDAPGAAPPEDAAERERWELRRRELYVGMTRARDGLWVGVV